MKVMNVTQFAEYVGQTRQSISEKLHTRKATESKKIIVGGKEYPFMRVAEKSVIIYVKEE